MFKLKEVKQETIIPTEPKQTKGSTLPAGQDDPPAEIERTHKSLVHPQQKMLLPHTATSDVVKAIENFRRRPRHPKGAKTRGKRTHPGLNFSLSALWRRLIQRSIGWGNQQTQI